MDNLSIEFIKAYFQDLIQELPHMRAEFENIRKMIHETPCPTSKAIADRVEHLADRVTTLIKTLTEEEREIIDLKKEMNELKKTLKELQAAADEINKLFIKIQTVINIFRIFKWPLLIAIIAIMYFIFPHTISTFLCEIKKVLSWIK